MTTMSTPFVLLIPFIFSFLLETDCESTVTYMGCYQDNGPSNRVFKGPHETFHNVLTPQKCIDYCLEKGFAYAGTEFSFECFCSKVKPPDNKRTLESECNMKCAGDQTRTCGGNNTLAVFSMLAPGDEGGALKPLGCFKDSKHHRVLNGNRKSFISHPLSNKKCIKRCRERGFRFAGTEIGYLCFCGDKAPRTNLMADPKQCNVPCYMNPDQSCGGVWRIAVYATNTTASVDPITSAPLACSTSETVVLGKEVVCSGDVIFEDLFDSPLDERWNHIEMVPNDTEFGFAVFSSNPENSFTRGNRLVIKPTFLNNTMDRCGSLNLRRCTWKAGRKSCVSSFNILPPVASAKISTRDSLSFRYGIVQIRAKLPIGDWLVPELLLEPRDHVYGPDFASGRIRIAMNRGNTDFKCNGEDFGHNRLESGLVMGLPNNVLRRSLETKLPPNWHDDFHNYTLVWTPETIYFIIDNEPPQQVVCKERRLCEIIGFGSQDCQTWSSGTKNAPFDREFYINLSLSVGNARDFPDECTNRGKPKPWRNLDKNATLRFSEDKENWQATWRDEESSLYIEHVRVTAL